MTVTVRIISLHFNKRFTQNIHWGFSLYRNLLYEKKKLEEFRNLYANILLSMKTIFFLF